MSLERFVQAQEKGGSYERALAELKAGRKTGHWIWWIFPQLKGLGTSHNSTYYGLADEAEARAYMRHPVLAQRYLECIREVQRHLSITGLSPLELMGSELDVLKLRSSAELMVRHVFASDDIDVLCSLPAILELLLVQNLGWKHPLGRIPKGLTDFGVFDQFVVTDMLREGHVLIAGIAGTGKSLLLNTQLLPWLRAQGHHHVVCDYHGDLDPLPQPLVFAPHQQSPAEIMALAGDALSSSAIVQRTDVGWSNGPAWNLFLADVISLVRSGKAPRKPWFLVVDVSSHLENMEALWGFLPEAKSYGCTIIATTQGSDRLPVGVTDQFTVFVQFHLAFRSSIEAVAPSGYPEWAKLVGDLKQRYFFLKTRGFSPRGFFLPLAGHVKAMFAILSDIHGNRPALESVFAEMEKLGVKRMLVLGDVIGYGPFPNDCLRMVAKAEVCLQGNHEAGVIGELKEQWFNDAAWGALEWTRKKLTHADREQIAKWRPTGIHDGIQLAHASLNPDAVFDYLLTPRALKAHFAAQTSPLCFVGHTHVPEIWIEGREDPVSWPKSGAYTLEPGRKTVINVGSVGLPRGGDDKRATWATYDSTKGEVTLRRTAYDVQEVIRTIKHLRHDPVVEAKLLRDLGA